MQRNKKIVLFYPRLSIQSSTFLQAPFSLLVIAPYLLKAGYQVQIVDTRLASDYQKIIQESLTEDTLFAGVTAMTGSQVTSAVEISKIIKKISSVPVVWGGIHASLLPQQVIRESYVDYVLVGEGENNVVEFANALASASSIRDVAGVYYKEKGEIKSTPKKPLFDMSQSLIPAWHLVDVSLYNNIGLQTARGCPFPCTYCYNVEYNQQRWRSKPLEMIFAEMEYLLKTYKLDSLFFYDDNFFTQKKRVEEICKHLIQNSLQVKWYTTCRADYFKRYGTEFFKLVRQSGCQTLAIGLESGSQNVLDLVRKKETVEDYYEMAKISAEVGIVPECGFMIGIPGETENDRNQTFNFMDDLVRINPKAYVTSLAIYTPYPGAPMIHSIEKEYGFKMPENLEGWGKYNFHNCNLTWLSKAERARLVAMSYIPRFVFWKHKLKERYVTKPLLPFYYVMTFLAGLRWRHRFFEFPIEYKLLNLFLKYRHFFTLKKFSTRQGPPSRPRTGSNADAAWVSS